jgi:LysM repeat protein
MQATGRVVVQPGESLWQLAQELAPQADPRSTVLRIRDLNHLSSDRVEAGQALVVPIFD